MPENKDEKTYRPLRTIAAEIRRDWSGAPGGINYAAKPYLEAMESLDSIEDNYFEDSGRTVVAYFLSNANTWRGETARNVKQELNSMLRAGRR